MKKIQSMLKRETKLKKVWNRIDGSVYLFLLFCLVCVLWQSGALHALFRQDISAFPFLFTRQVTNAAGRVVTSVGVFNYFISYLPSIWTQTFITLQALLPGFLIGALVGYAFALIAVIFKNWGGGALTVLTLLVSFPIVALAPAVNNICGSANAYGGKLVIVILCCMAGMSVNAYKGLQSVKPFSEDLMKISNATSLTTFFSLRLPSSLPNVFTALKVNVATAMSAVFISEYYSQTSILTGGMGKNFREAFSGLNNAKAWAYILMAILVGLILYTIIVFLEKKLIGWHASQRRQS